MAALYTYLAVQNQTRHLQEPQTLEVWVTITLHYSPISRYQRWAPVRGRICTLNNWGHSVLELYFKLIAKTQAACKMDCWILVWIPSTSKQGQGLFRSQALVQAHLSDLQQHSVLFATLFFVDQWFLVCLSVFSALKNNWSLGNNLIWGCKISFADVLMHGWDDTGPILSPMSETQKAIYPGNPSPGTGFGGDGGGKASKAITVKRKIKTISALFFLWPHLPAAGGKRWATQNSFLRIRPLNHDLKAAACRI